jgi:hypothetical protein
MRVSASGTDSPPDEAKYSIETNSFGANQLLFASIPEAALGQYGHHVAEPSSTGTVDGYQASADPGSMQRTSAATRNRVLLFI